MRFILKAFLSYIPRRRALSALLTLGVAFGVASAIGMEISSRQTLKSMERTVSFAGGTATHILRSTAGALDESILKELSSDRSVERFAPVIDKMVSLQAYGLLRVLGVDPFLEPPFRGWLYEGGREDYLALFNGHSKLILDKKFAATIGVEKGGKIVTDRGEAIVANFFNVPSDQPMALMEISAAQKFFSIEGKINRVDLILNDPEGFIDRWGKRYSVMTAGENRAILKGMLASFQLNLKAISLLGLFIGIFLVYNTATFAVASRKKDAGILLALGAYRREVGLAFMSELVILGLLGGLIGSFVGYAFSLFLTEIVGTTVSNLYFFLAPEKPEWSWLYSLTGAALGLSTCLIAGARPVAQYVTIKPLEVLHGRAPEKDSRRNALYYGLAGVLLAALAAILYLLELEGFFPGALVVTLLFISASFLAPLITYYSMTAVRPFFMRNLGVKGAVSVENLKRRLGRTSVAVAAFSVALAASIGMGLMITSFRSTLVWWLNSQLTGQIYIATAAELEIPEEFFERIKTIPNIDGVDPYTNVRVFIGGDFANISAVNPLVLKRFADFGWFEGDDESWDEVEAGKVIISESFYRRFNVSSGDEIPLNTPVGVARLRVAGIFYDYTSEHGVLMMSRGKYISLFGDHSIDSLGIFFDNDNKMKNLAISEIKALAESYRLPVQEKEGLHTDILSVFDSTFATTRSMQFLALIIASLGLLGSMLTMLIEKKKDLGIFRALGLGRGDIIAMTALEGIFVGAISIFISMFLGVLVSFVLINSINMQSFNWTIFFNLEARPFIEAFFACSVGTILSLVYPLWIVFRTYPNLQLRND